MAIHIRRSIGLLHRRESVRLGKRGRPRTAPPPDAAALSAKLYRGAKNAGAHSKFLGDNDLISDQELTRTKLLAFTIKKPFQRLDRRLRQEILSMDGATVLKHTGEVLAAGSIVRVPAGSAGGGRRAAALQLSKHGLAIKISADGPVTGFRNQTTIFSL